MTLSNIIRSRWMREIAIFASLLSVALLVNFLISDLSFATSLISPDDNVEAVAQATGGESDGRTIAKTIINYFLSFLGFIASVMIIYGGVLYVTSAGNEDNAGKAKTILMHAATGIILILVSFAIVNTVLQAGGGSGAADNTAPVIVNP